MATQADSGQAFKDGYACHASVAALPNDALALLEAAGCHDFQMSAAWFENFAQTVDCPGAQAEFHTWREGGRLLVLMPLLSQAGTVTALGNYYTTRWAPLMAEGLQEAQAVRSLQGLLTALLRERNAHTLRLGPLQTGSSDEVLLEKALRGIGCAVWPLHAFQNWALAVDTSSNQVWGPYLASRDGQLRNTIKRMSKRFAAKGGRLELVLEGPRLQAGIRAYEAVYSASWKEPEPHSRFMPGMIRAAAKQGRLRLGLAWLGEQPVAAQVWLVDGKRANIYKLAHDEAHKETSPGTLLTAHLMQHVLEVDRVTLVDYLSGDDAYKRLWMNQVSERRHLLAYRLGSPRGLALAARHGLGLLQKRLLGRLHRPSSDPNASPRETSS